MLHLSVSAFSLRLGEPQKDSQQMNVIIYICDIGDLKTWPAGCHVGK